VRIYKVLLAL